MCSDLCYGSDPFSVCYHEPSSGSLFAAHCFPPSSHQTVARINIDHVLESIRLADLQVGAWINIIGYTTSRSLNPVYQFGIPGPAVSCEISVQATVVWNARELDIQNYEAALAAKKAASRVTVPS
jgi:Telomere capping, CST complex subunit